MVELNVSLQHCTIEYKLCWWWGFFCFLRNGQWTKSANTATLMKKFDCKIQILKPISTIIWEVKDKYTNFNAKNGEMCMMMHHDNTHQENGPNKTQQKSGWDSQMDLNLVPSAYWTLKHVKSICHIMWLNWVNDMVSVMKLKINFCLTLWWWTSFRKQ